MILVAMAAAVTIMIVVAAIVSVKKAAVAMIMDCVATKGSKELVVWLVNAPLRGM